MERTEAIRAAIEEANRQEQGIFKDKVQTIVWRIGRLSAEIKSLKKELMGMEYQAPEFPDDLS